MIWAFSNVVPCGLTVKEFTIRCLASCVDVCVFYRRCKRCEIWVESLWWTQGRQIHFPMIFEVSGVEAEHVNAVVTSGGPSGMFSQVCFPSNSLPKIDLEVSFELLSLDCSWKWSLLEMEAWQDVWMTRQLRTSSSTISVLCCLPMAMPSRGLLKLESMTIIL